MDKTTKAYQNLRHLVEMNNYDLDSADALLVVQKTKGNQLGMFTLGYSKQTNSYYECKKIDPAKDAPEKPIMFVPESEKIENKIQQIGEIDPEDPLFDLPF